MPAAVGPVAGHRHHPIGHVPQLAQILLGRQDDAVAPLGIAGLIDDEHPARMRSQERMRLPALQPAPIERFGVPGGVVQEVVQRLAMGCRDDRRQFDERLVVLARQQQADEVLPQGRALLARPNRSSNCAQNWSIASVVGGVGWRGAAGWAWKRLLPSAG